MVYLSDYLKKQSEAKKMSKNINFVCPKCRNKSYETGEIQATGGFVSKVLDVQNKKFAYITCIKCKYTEFYKGDTSMLGNIFDLFT